MTVGGTDADETAENEVVACGPTADENDEGAELDAMVVALPDEETVVLSVDDGGITLDEGTLEEEAT